MWVLFFFEFFGVFLVKLLYQAMPDTRAVRDLWGCQLEPNRRSNWRTVCGHCLRLRTEHTVSTKQGEHKGDGMLGMIATYSSYNLCFLCTFEARTMMDQGRLPTLDTGGNTANRRSVMIHATSTTTTTKLSSRKRAVLKGTATAATEKLKTTLTDVAEQWNSVGVAGHQELRRWALTPSDRNVFLLSTARVSIAASVYSPANMHQSLQYCSVYCTISELQNSWALGQLDPQILKDKLPQSTIHQQTATHYWHQLNASLTNCTEWHSLWILDHTHAALSASLGSGLHLHWHAQTLSESLLDRWERNGGTGRNNQAFAPSSLCQ